MKFLKCGLCLGLALAVIVSVSRPAKGCGRGQKNVEYIVAMDDVPAVQPPGSRGGGDRSARAWTQADEPKPAPPKRTQPKAAPLQTAQRQAGPPQTVQPRTTQPPTTQPQTTKPQTAPPAMAEPKLVWQGPMVDSKGNRDTGVLELLLWSRPIPGQPDFTGRWAGVPIQKGQIIRGESVERTHLYWEHTGAGKIICKVWAFPKGSASSPFAEMDITYRVFDGETGLFSGQARVGLQNTAPKAAVQSAAVTKTAADTTKAANTKPAAAKQAVPKVWTFKYTSPVSGQFAPSRVKGGQWVETNAEGAYHFIEMSRKSEYIELYDPSRQITVRLYATSCHIRRPANPDQFVLLYDGRWE